MFEKPLFTIPDLQRHPGNTMSHQSAVNMLNKLAQANLVEKVAPGRGRAAAIWKFSELTTLLE